MTATADTEQVLALHSEIVGAVLAWHEQPDRWENHLRDLATQREAIIDADEIAAGGDQWQPPSILGRVIAERRRQDAEWPDDDQLEDRTGPDERLWGFWDGPTFESACLHVKRRNDDAELTGAGLADLLLEEVFEACQETEPQRIVAELIQTAALAIKWAENIESRSATNEQ